MRCALAAEYCSAQNPHCQGQAALCAVAAVGEGLGNLGACIQMDSLIFYLNASAEVVGVKKSLTTPFNSAILLSNHNLYNPD